MSQNIKTKYCAPEGSPSIKKTYTIDGRGKLLTNYSNGNVSSTFTWEIVGYRSDLGVISVYLETVNTADFTEKYNYEIIGLTDSEMYLQWYRGEGEGLGKVSKYEKI